MKQVKENSKEESSKAKEYATQAVNQAAETMLFPSMKPREQLHEERAAASQKIAAAVSKAKVKLKKSEERAVDLKQKLSQEKEHLTATTRLANKAIMSKQQAKHGVVPSTTWCLEEKYRTVIEKLQDELKSSKSSFKNSTLDLQQKDKETDELKCVFQVCTLTFFDFPFLIPCHLRHCCFGL